MQNFKFEAIAVAHSDYREKFAIPRQPNLAPAARAWLEVDPIWVERGALEGLQSSTHVWLQFVFHAIPKQQTRGLVRPPRLGGNKKLGVFATRSTYRPNPIGLSVVQLISIDRNRVFIGGADLLDGTPILDIKPYLPWCDSIPEAQNLFATQKPSQLKVEFSEIADQALSLLAEHEATRIRQLLEQCLGQDPRPAYQRNLSTRVYGVRIAGLEVQWTHPDEDRVIVANISSSD